MKKLFFLHVWLNLTRIAEKEQVENIHLFCFLYLIHCFINLFTFFDVYFEMNRIKNDANTHCI